MPRKDSVTGCMVMTESEFWKAEAEKTGFEPWMLRENFNNEMREAEMMEERRLRNIKDAWEFIKPCLQGWEDDRIPVEVVKVDRVNVHFTVKSASTEVLVYAKDSKNEVNKLRVSMKSWSGTMLDPPEEEVEVEWMEEKKEGE